MPQPSLPSWPVSAEPYGMWIGWNDNEAPRKDLDSPSGPSGQENVWVLLNGLSV
jgi:hypothetical protein